MGRTSFVRLVWRSVVSLAVVGALMGLAPAGAAASQGAGGAFNDDDGSVHEAALDALASRGVLAGTECGDKLICPGAPLRRWEMAVWLVRVLDGTNPGSADSERFSDLDYQQWWAPFVERLFDLGVTSGCRLEPLRYCPDRAVTRAEMATFLARAFDLEPAAPAGFTDLAEGPHAASINALAAAGITAGCVREPLQYCPADGVTRGQMASFVARAMGVIESPADVRVSGIDAGWWHSCGLRVDGSIDCWGSNPFGQADAPAGEFSALTAGAHHSCGLRDDGSAECWGSNIVGQLGAPAGRFVALSAGWGHTCGVRTDQYLECWGVNWNGRADPPVGQFSVVAAGDEFTCGLRVDGSIDCWGRLHDGQIPAGRFSAIAVGRRHSCAVQVQGAIACWGANWSGQAAAPDGRFSAVTVGLSHSCAVRIDAAIVCWGSNGLGQAEAPPGYYLAVATGYYHSCGLRSVGDVVCWGGDSMATAGAPSGRFASIDAGLLHLCGVRTDGSLICTGGNPNGQLDVPDGEFTAVTASDWFSCGLRADGTASCWGLDAHGETFVPPERFSSISAGYLHSCGLRGDGTATCWGEQPPAPDGLFQAVTVSVGGWHSCGLRTDGAVTCWGSNRSGQADSPEGQFKAVAAGREHSCGLRSDGTIACWGLDVQGRTDAPHGTFRSLATGVNHSCAVGIDGTVTCWGDNYFGQLNVPEGQFQAVTADREYSCGLRTDGTVECWGLAQVVHPPTDVVTGAEPALAGLGECQQRGTRNNTTAGFPLPRSALASTGTLRVAVLFVDFPNAIAPYSTLDEADRSLGFIEGFLEASSYGRLDIELRPHHRWLRARHDYDHYLHGSSLGSQSLQLGIAEEAARIADPDFDFSGVDALMVVHPSVYFGGGGTGQERIETQEGEVQTLLINTFRVEGRPSAQQWGDVAAHELVHNLGLADLYPYDARRHEPHVGAGDRTWFLTEFGPMGLRAYGPSGRAGYREAIEMLAWSRWQLGWLDEAQIRCIEEPIATVTLSPVADPGDGIAMAAVPLSDTEVIVIESRRSLGYDSGALLDEGVLVYTVDAMISSGLLPMKLAGDPGNAHFDDYPLLRVGESVTVRGYTITVDTDDGNTHTVTVTRDEQG